MGQDSVFGIATRYGLQGPGTESRWGARFSAPVQTDPGAHPASQTLGTGSFPGVKAGGLWRWPPTPSMAAVKERVQLYIYSSLGPSWPVPGWTLETLLDNQFKLKATGNAWGESLRNLCVMLRQHLENGRVHICCEFPSEAITNVTRHVTFDREHN
jgi:hypothetical protein